jgi:hypothetical protein
MLTYTALEEDLGENLVALRITSINGYNVTEYIEVEVHE